MSELTPQELAARLASFSSKDLSAMPHSTLYAARSYIPKDRQDQQDQLAAYEHRAFAREASRESPMLALPIAIATPLYTGAKAMGLINKRSKPSLDQMGQGLRGVGEGLWGAFQDRMQAGGLLQALQTHLRGRS